MKPKSRVRMDDLAPPQDHLDIVATRRRDEQPERWRTTVTIDERKLDLGSFPSVGQALYNGVQVYYASRVPLHLRNKRQKLLE